MKQINCDKCPKSAEMDTNGFANEWFPPLGWGDMWEDHRNYDLCPDCVIKFAPPPVDSPKEDKT